jgi:hypothetical protein
MCFGQQIVDGKVMQNLQLKQRCRPLIVDCRQLLRRAETTRSFHPVGYTAATRFGPLLAHCRLGTMLRRTVNQPAHFTLWDTQRRHGSDLSLSTVALGTIAAEGRKPNRSFHSVA